jgi:hypothetical protein
MPVQKPLNVVLKQPLGIIGRSRLSQWSPSGEPRWCTTSVRDPQRDLLQYNTSCLRPESARVNQFQAQVEAGAYIAKVYFLC